MQSSGRQNGNAPCTFLWTTLCHGTTRSLEPSWPWRCYVDWCPGEVSSSVSSVGLRNKSSRICSSMSRRRRRAFWCRWLSMMAMMMNVVSAIKTTTVPTNDHTMVIPAPRHGTHASLRYSTRSPLILWKPHEVMSSSVRISILWARKTGPFFIWA